MDVGKNLLEGITANELYLLIVEILVCRNVMKRSLYALNGDSFHLIYYCLFFVRIAKTNVPLHIVMKRDFVCNLLGGVVSLES